MEDSVDLVEKALQQLKQAHEKGESPLLQLPYLRKDLADLAPTVMRFQDEFDDIVILGTGGSSLGGQALQSLQKDNSIHLHFVDNVDPTTLDHLLHRLNLNRTGFIVISKSGNTPETVMQFLCLMEVWQTHHCPHRLAEHTLVITEEKDSSLQKLAKAQDIPLFPHDPHLGGRFSVLSVVGVLPNLIVGLDAVALREGAAAVLEDLFEAKPLEEKMPVMGAMCAAAYAKSHPLQVMFPYADSLAVFGKWYRQLWAESLGKDGKGTTPIDALGPVDQHSQLQLYLDGPKDKIFTLLRVKNSRVDLRTPAVDLPEDPLLDLLKQHSMQGLLDAEAEATEKTLLEKGCPVRVLEMEQFDERAFGALLMHFMIETILTGAALQVDPYDQPAVERGKILTREILEARAP